jgi:hypothetical protein
MGDHHFLAGLSEPVAAGMGGETKTSTWSAMLCAFDDSQW